jgi:hypothetical protein
MAGGCVALAIVPLYLYAERLRLRSTQAIPPLAVVLTAVNERVGLP